MNIRKTVDGSALYAVLDTLMGAELTEMALYYETGKAVCARTEKGAAVISAEYLQGRYPDRRGFPPRDLHRMRTFYLAYAERPDLLEKTQRLGWTLDVVILEECQTVDERTWYLNAAMKYGWSKSELLSRIQDGTWLKTEADKFGGPCYTERKTVEACQQNEEDSFCLSRQYLQEPDGRVCEEGPDSNKLD